MKRLAVILLLVAALVLSACQTPAAPTTAPKLAEATQAPAATERTLGLVLSTLNNPFFVTLRDGGAESGGCRRREIDRGRRAGRFVPR